MKNYIIGFVAVAALVVGVIGVSKNSKVGLDGQQGVQGENGAQGVKGDKGERGERGLQGERGAKGESGAIGMPGKLGAVSGPEITSPFLSVHGVETYSFSSLFNKASSTICAFKTPAATSTLLFGSLKVSDGLNSALFFEIGKSTVMDATTTSLGTYSAGSGTKFTMIASTTAVDNVDDARIIAPSNYIVFKTSSTTPAQLTGTCKAELLVN